MSIAIRIGAGRAQGLSPWVKLLGGLVVLITVVFFLSFLVRQYVFAQIVSLEKTATLTAAANGWVEASSSTADNVVRMSFVLSCTPGPEEDEYFLSGTFLMDQFSNRFRLPRSGLFGCRPNLNDPSAVAQLINAVFKAMGGESKAQYAQELYRSVAESVVNVLKAKIPFLGF